MIGECVLVGSKHRKHTREGVAVTLFAVMVSLVLAGPAYGTVLPISVEAMSDRATKVVLADVVSVESRADEVDVIATDIVLHPIKTLKGETDSVLTVTIPGGTLGAEAVWVSDSPTFSAGERVLLFLDAEGRVIAGPQGRLDVVGDTIPTENESLARVEARVIGAPRPGARNALPELFGLVDGSAAMAPQAEPNSVVTMATPVVGNITPPQSPAGTGDTITITGSDFGASPGFVEFFYREGRAPVIASGGDIHEWSDTKIVTEVPIATIGGYAAAPGCGPVTVVSSDGGRSTGTQYTITFAYGGVSWGDTNQTYYVNPNTADTTGELAMVQAAADTWSAAGSFNLVYAGTTSTYSSSLSLGNGINEVFWDDLPDSYLGQARYRYFIGGEIIEADFAFNDDYDWTDGTVAGTYDIQSTATHEMGHWLNLRDQYGDGDSVEVMYGWGNSGTQKRSLHAYDLQGIRWIYDADHTPPVTTASGAPSGWTNNDVTVSLSATDTESGVAETLYRIGGSLNQTYSAPMTFTAEGSTSLYYWSVDTSGNVEPTNVAVIQIDRTPPITAAPATTKYVGVAQFDLNASDSRSGIAQTYWRLDGGSLQAGSVLRITSAGDHTVAYYSEDRAGNTETEKTYSFSLRPSPDVTRVAGFTRYSTAIETSRHNFSDDSVPVVVLATGSGFADALTASGLAGCYDAPLLLTPSNSVAAGLVAEMERLGVSEVMIVGGSSAVSDSVVDELHRTGYGITRIGGSDRYDTAAQVARQIAALEGTDFVGEAFLARGDSFADALAAAPYAYSRRMPVLLTRPTSLPLITQRTADDLPISKVYVTGGTGAISNGVVNQLEVSYERAGGDNRYDTASEVANLAISKAWITPTTAGVTTGQNYPDALSGGAAMGSRDGVMLLTPTSNLYISAEDILSDCEHSLDEVQVFGGNAAVSSATYNSVCGLWE